MKLPDKGLPNKIMLNGKADGANAMSAFLFENLF